MNIEDKEKAMLADDLIAYINEKHTQEECIAFIYGYESALKKLKKLRVADVSVPVCDCGNFEVEAYSPCCSLSCWEDKFS